MALNPSNLSSELEDSIRTAVGLDETLYPQLTAICNAIANTIVSHIQANAELSNATFSGTFAGSVTGSTCSTTITDHPVTGGIT